MDAFELNKRQLKRILKKLNEEIDVQLEKTDESKINLSNTKSILGRIDNFIVNHSKIAEGMAGDEETRKAIKQMIDDINKEVKKELDNFKGYLSNDDKIREIDKIYKDVVQNNKTNKTQKQLDEFEEEIKKADGKYSLGNIDERIETTEKEFQEAKTIFNRKEEYEKIKKSSKKDDNALQAEFKEFQKDAQEWKDSLQKLEKIKKYDYVKNIDELIDLANAGIDVDDDLKKKFKDLQSHLHLIITDDKAAKALDGIDLKKADITEIRTALEALKAMDIGEIEEIKDNEKSVKAVNQNFMDAIDKTEILRLFAKDRGKIKDDIENDDKPLSEKWKNIVKFVKNNEKTIKNLSTKTKEEAKLEMQERYIKLNRLKQEKDTEKTTAEKPDTTAIDLSELGLDENHRVVYGDEFYDFSKVKEDDMESIVDILYGDIRRNKDAFNKTKNYLGENTNLPAVKQPRFFRRIRAFFNRIMRRPSAEERQWEPLIRKELEERVLGVKDKKTEFDKQLELTGADKKKYEEAVRRLIIEGGGNEKPKDIVRKAEKSIDEEIYK